MPQTTRKIFVQLTSAGIDTGPFDITDSFATVLATSVPKADLIAPGYGKTYSVALASTYIRLQSTGLCTSYVDINIPAIVSTTTTTTTTAGIVGYSINVVPNPVTPGAPFFGASTITVTSAPVSITLRSYGGGTPGGSTTGYVTIDTIGSFSTSTATTGTYTYTSIPILSNGTYNVSSFYGTFIGSSGNEVTLL